jgi:hypothetical protein
VLQEHLRCLKDIQDSFSNNNEFNIPPISDLYRDNIVEEKFIEK